MPEVNERMGTNFDAFSRITVIFLRETIITTQNPIPERDREQYFRYSSIRGNAT